MLTAYRGKGMWQRQLVNNHYQTFLWQEVKDCGKDNQWTTITVRLVTGKYNHPQLTGLPATFRSAMCCPHERGFFWNPITETASFLPALLLFLFFCCDRLAIYEILPVFFWTEPKFQRTSPSRHFANSPPPPPPDDLWFSNTTGIPQNMQICMICLYSQQFTLCYCLVKSFLRNRF